MLRGEGGCVSEHEQRSGASVAAVLAQAASRATAKTRRYWHDSRLHTVTVHILVRSARREYRSAALGKQLGVQHCSKFIPTPPYPGDAAEPGRFVGAIT